MGEAKTDIVVRVGTAIAAQIAGNVHPGLGVAAAGAKELIDPALTALIAKVSDWRRDRAAVVWEVGCTESGLDPETLASLLSRDEARLLLTAETVDAAMRTSVPEKLMALGRVLANSAHDGAKVDQERLVVAALAAMEAPHVRLLGILIEEPPARTMQRQLVRAAGWTRADIVAALSGFEDVLNPLLVTLHSNGLIKNDRLSQTRFDSTGTGDVWSATRFGQMCAERLR